VKFLKANLKFLIPLILLIGVVGSIVFTGYLILQETNKVQSIIKESPQGYENNQNVEDFPEQRKEINRLIREADNKVTYTYIIADQTGEYKFLGESRGQGHKTEKGFEIKLKDPKNNGINTIYTNAHIIISPFKLN